MKNTQYYRKHSLTRIFLSYFKPHMGLFVLDILCAAVTSVVCFCVGLTISFGFSTPVGATVVAADLTVFLAACLLAALRRK